MVERGDWAEMESRVGWGKQSGMGTAGRRQAEGSKR